MPRSIEDYGLNFKPYEDLLSNVQKMARDLHESLKILETFEAQNCKSRSGRELQVGSLLKVRETRQILSDSYNNLRSLSKQSQRIRLARDIIESAEESNAE